MKIFRTLVVALIGLSIASLAAAHHSRANFLLRELITVEGTVKHFQWTSPHMWIIMDAENEGGELVEWTVEGNAIAPLMRFGWDPETVKPGDRITFVGNPDKNPDKKLMFLDYLVRPDGNVFYNLVLPDEEAQKLAAAQAPAAPSTDYTGVWERIANTEYFLLGAFNPPTNWPVTELGQQQVDAFDLNEDPFYQCIPNSIPKMITAPFGHKWTRHENAIFIEKELSPVGRTIHLREDFPEDVEPTREGYSIGYFEDDGALIIESKFFTYDKWGLARGLDSSEQKHLHERWTLTKDGYGMHLTLTITDPVYLAEPFVMGWDYNKVKDYDLIQEECTLDSAGKHLQMEAEQAGESL